MRRLAQANASGRGVVPGLERMTALSSALGLLRPRPSCKLVHVAGTNGKGSVCHKVQLGLRATGGKSVGVFTSPHVGTYRERVQVDGSLISEREAEDALDALEHAEKATGVEATYFEKLTLLAMLHFERRGVDFAIFEAGLGGLEDSTNVIVDPAVCVITSVALDHQEFLGGTVEAIARAKAGIFKPGCHAVIGPRARPAGLLEEIASAAGVASFSQVSCPDGASVDTENSLIAQTVLSCLGRETSLHQLDGERPAGRFERFELDAGRLAILDAAHNPDAMARLRQELAGTASGRGVHVVATMAASKDIDASFAALFGMAASGAKPSFALASVTVAPGGNASRSADVERLAASATAAAGPTVRVAQAANMVAAFDAALGASKPGEVVVVCGSFNALGEIRHKRLCPDSELDETNLNESKL